MATVLIRLESRGRRAVAIGLTTAALGLLGWDAVRRATAEGVASRAASVADFERAAAWAPDNPDLRLRAADANTRALDEADPVRARAHLEAARAARPTHGGTWLRLAMLDDREGRREEAREALATAVRLDRDNAALRWEAALLALGWGDREAALEHLRYVLEVDYARRDAAFQIARTLLPPGVPVTTLLPPDPDTLTAILSVAVRDREVELSEAVWERRAGLEPPLSPGLQRRFLDLLLEEGEGAVARRLWTAIAPAAGADPRNAVWNGSFEQERLVGWGFDWQVRRMWGVETRLDAAQAARGQQSLKLAFNAFPTLDFAGIWQLVPVEPGRIYRLSALVKAKDFVTRSGLKVQVVTHDDGLVLAETAPVSGTTGGWVPLEATLRVPAEVSLVRVRLRRERAPGPEGNLGGKVWVDDVSLTLMGRAGT